ncbi:ROK family transcriptional regulator [Microlunatus endophyticus]
MRSGPSGRSGQGFSALQEPTTPQPVLRRLTTGRVARISDRGAQAAAYQGANQYDLGLFNEYRIIETIRQAGTISRTEISEQTGLTQQAVSRILRTLLDRGLVAEAEQERAERLGKPRTPVRLRAEAAYAAGVLVDPESLTCVLADLDGEVIQRRRLSLTARTSPSRLVAEIDKRIAAMIRAAAIAPASFLGVGVATPGPITPDGELLDLPLSEAWRNVPLRQLLAERLNCPVVVDKDGQAAAIGERWIGRTQRSGDFAFLYFGTGIGSGLVLNGDAYRGVSSNAGEFGQLCAIRTGNLDASGQPQLVRECNPTLALPAIAKELGYRGTATSYREMCAEVGAGDPAAVAAARQIADVISVGAVALIDLLDLPLVVVGGPAFEPELAEIMLTAISRAVNTAPTAHAARQVAVERSLLNEVGALGAASTIFHEAFTPSAGRAARP